MRYARSSTRNGLRAKTVSNPLSRVKPKAGVRVRFSALRDRPQLAVEAMQVIATWAYTDTQLACLTATFLKADFVVVSAMLDALTSSDGKRAAITGAADAVLDKTPGDEWDLFQRVMGKINPWRKTRNAFAHSLWAVSDDLPNALLLVEPTEEVRQSNQFAVLKSGIWRPGTFTYPKFDKSKVAVWREKDLKKAVKESETAYSLVSKLAGALGEPGPYSDQQWLALCLALGDGPSPPRTWRKKNQEALRR